MKQTEREEEAERRGAEGELECVIAFIRARAENRARREEMVALRFLADALEDHEHRRAWR